MRLAAPELVLSILARTLDVSDNAELRISETELRLTSVKGPLERYSVKPSKCAVGGKRQSSPDASLDSGLVLAGGGSEGKIGKSMVGELHLSEREAFSIEDRGSVCFSR